ncbi:MAG: rhomboid family intramembrane serine protease [Acidobacteriota bacterium]
MIPIQDVIPSRQRPWATLAIVSAMAAGLVCAWFVSPDAIRGLVYGYGWTGAQLWWLFPVPAFLHLSLVHAGTNMLALWIFGDTMEDRLGHARFAALYALGAIVSWTVVVATHPVTAMPGIGAGGAVAAVIGAYLAQLPRSRVLVLVPLPFVFDLVEIPAAIVPAFWCLLQIIGVAGSGGGVTAAAQVLWAIGAGGLTGAGVGWALRGKRPEWEMPWT